MQLLQHVIHQAANSKHKRTSAFTNKIICKISMQIILFFMILHRIKAEKRKYDKNKMKLYSILPHSLYLNKLLSNHRQKNVPLIYEILLKLFRCCFVTFLCNFSDLLILDKRKSLKKKLNTCLAFDIKI